MYTEQRRYGRDPEVIQRTAESTWKKPLSWNRKAEKAGKRAFVFVGSWMDFCINVSACVPWRAEFWALVRETPWLTWLLLTKRPERYDDCLPADWGCGYANVLLGATVEEQRYESRIAELFCITTEAGYFLSIEPMLGPVALPSWLFSSAYDGLLRAVFAGGETGAAARPCHPRWVHTLRNQCVASEVPFMWKGWGEWLPVSQFPEAYCWKYLEHDPALRNQENTYIWPDGTHNVRVGKVHAGRLLDGVEWNGMPEVGW